MFLMGCSIDLLCRQGFFFNMIEWEYGLDKRMDISLVVFAVQHQFTLF